MQSSDILCKAYYYIIQISVVICRKIYLTFSQYFRHTEVLILKVFRREVLLILSNPTVDFKYHINGIKPVYRRPPLVTIKIYFSLHSNTKQGYLWYVLCNFPCVMKK